MRNATTRSLNLLDLVAFLFILIATALALYRPIIPYDSWWYHLPFSARLFGIGGGAATFHVDPLSTERWWGFPLLWEWICGALWFLTGALRSIIIPQILLCLTFFAYLWRVQQVPFSWVIFGLFASPMVLIHYEATYLDLPAGLLIALGFFLFVDLIEAAGNGETPLRSAKAPIAVACFAAAGNIKYQGLIGAVAVTAAIAILCLAFRTPARFRGAIACLLILANLLGAISVLKNWSLLGSPTYPIAIAVGDKTFFPGPESPDRDNDKPSYLIGGKSFALPEPVNFALSLTELDWTLRGVVPWYNVDALAGKFPIRGGPGRTGGFGAAFIAFNLTVLIIQLVFLRKESDRKQKIIVLGAALVLVLTALLPRSHELRYWFFLPLILAGGNLRFLARNNFPPELVQAALAAGMLFGVSLAALSPRSQLLRTTPVSMTDLRGAIPTTVELALQGDGRYCDASDDGLFRYSEAVTGRKGVLSRDPSDCR